MPSHYPRDDEETEKEKSVSEWEKKQFRHLTRQYPEEFRPYDPNQLWNKMEPTLYEKYFKTLEETGLFRAAADSVGCHVNHVQLYRRDVPEFEEMVQAALERFRETILERARDRALNGTLRPIIGGRNRDQIVAWEVKQSDRLLELFLKKVDPEGFNERSKVEVKSTNLTEHHFEFGRMSRRSRRMLRELIHTMREDAGEYEDGVPEDPILASDREEEE